MYCLAINFLQKSHFRPKDVNGRNVSKRKDICKLQQKEIEIVKLVFNKDQQTFIKKKVEKRQKVLYINE